MTPRAQPCYGPAMLSPIDIRFSVAPMMDWTDRHCRSLHRILSRRARLYTEMVTPGAVLIGRRCSASTRQIGAAASFIAHQVDGRCVEIGKRL